MNNTKTHEALRIILSEPRFAGKTDQERFDTLSAKTIVIKRDVDTRDIQSYLMLLRKWIPLKNSTEQTAVRAVEILNGLDTLTMTNSAIDTEVTFVLTALADDTSVTFFNNNDKSIILSMSKKYVSEIDRLGLSGVRVGHVIVAGSS